MLSQESKTLLDIAKQRIDENIMQRAIAAEYAVEQQQKVIENLEEQLALLKPEKRLIPKKNPRVKLARNASWKRSAWLGLRESVWFAPLNFFELVGANLAGLVYGVFATLVAIFGWILARPGMIVFGLCGYISDDGERK